ncbi:MAG: ANTAR domain-containing protein [Clostridia bacterium]|nr:ANTAR domain-containing protein [Clostridia bacterium]
MDKAKYRILVAGKNEKLKLVINDVLPVSEYEQIRYVSDAGEVRRNVLDNPPDMLIINTPLPDDFGVELALDLSDEPMGILLLVKNEIYNQVCYKVEDSGVLTLGKPLTRQSFYTAIKMLTALSARLHRMDRKNQSLKEKMNDIRVVNRAKWLLIENLHMSESEAHHLIEKQAMDLRLSRKQVAERIITTYDN